MSLFNQQKRAAKASVLAFALVLGCGTQSAIAQGLAPEAPQLDAPQIPTVTLSSPEISPEVEEETAEEAQPAETAETTEEPRPPAAQGEVIAQSERGGRLTFTSTLDRFLPRADEVIYLRNAASSYTVFLPMPARYDAVSMRIQIPYTNSNLLLNHRSQLVVVLNDVVQDQVRLRNDVPYGEMDVSLNVEDLVVGFNRLQFVVAQHVLDECEDPAAPELWTNIDPTKVLLTMNAQANDIDPRLSRIGDLIDPKLWTPGGIHLVFPGADAVFTNTQLNWGGIISQGVALKLGYKPLNLAFASRPRVGADNILIGTLADVAEFLTQAEAAQVNGSYIALKQMPDDPKNFLMIITGRNFDEVQQAAIVFSLLNFPMPDSYSAVVEGLMMPVAPRHVRRPPIVETGLYSFERLGVETTTIKGINTGAVVLRLMLPGDAFFRPEGNVDLRLNFSYGAKLREDSVLNVMANGFFARSMAMHEKDGDYLYRYGFPIPIRYLQPGENIIEIRPQMVPLITGNCQAIQTENLYFTLYNDSQVFIPPMRQVAQLPNMKLASQIGYPFGHVPDGSELAVFVADKDSDTIVAAWTFLAKLSQISNALLFRTQMTFDSPRTDDSKHLVAVGPHGVLPQDLADAAPIAPSQNGDMRYQLKRSPIALDAVDGNLVDSVVRLVAGQGETPITEPVEPSADFDIASDQEQDGVALSFQNPYHGGRASILLSAKSPRLLRESIDRLIMPSFWSELDGDVTVWGLDKRTIEHATLGESFYVGEIQVVEHLQREVSEQPLRWIFIALVGIALLVLFTRLLTKKLGAA